MHPTQRGHARQASKALPLPGTTLGTRTRERHATPPRRGKEGGKNHQLAPFWGERQRRLSSAMVLNTSGEEGACVGVTLDGGVWGGRGEIYLFVRVMTQARLHVPPSPTHPHPPLYPTANTGHVRSSPHQMEGEESALHQTPSPHSNPALFLVPATLIQGALHLTLR
jgi:hypothetical protein